MVFSTNQVRQLYVVNKIDTPANVRGLVASTYPDPSKAGTIAPVVIGDYDNPAGMNRLSDAIEFLYVNAHGEINHTDIIKRDNIRSIKFTDHSKLRTKLQTWTITRDDSLSILTPNGEETYSPSVHDIYYINFSFPGFQNATDEEVETKTVAFKWDSSVHNHWADAAVDAIQKAFKKRNNLDNKLVNVAKVSNDVVEVWAPEGTTWRVGTHDNKPNRIVISDPELEIFSVAGLTSLPLENSSRVVKCGTSVDSTDTTSHVIGNGKLTADLEYFCMGERGDQYRMKGWPNVIYTDYMVNPAYEYNYVDIHFYFQGEGVRSDKSEKVLTLVTPCSRYTAVTSPDVSDIGDYYELANGVYTKTGDVSLDNTKTYYTQTYTEVDLEDLVDDIKNTTNQMTVEDISPISTDAVITVDENYTAGEIHMND